MKKAYISKENIENNKNIKKNICHATEVKNMQGYIYAEKLENRIMSKQEIVDGWIEIFHQQKKYDKTLTLEEFMKSNIYGDGDIIIDMSDHYAFNANEFFHKYNHIMVS